VNAGSRLTVQVVDGNPVMVRVTGEVDLLAAPELARPLRELIVRRKPPAIEVDLAGVPFMDSTGIQVLVSAHTDARAADIPFRVRDVSSSVRRVLAMTGLLETLGVKDLEN